ncbi:hypothetical protein LQE88_00760 [Acidaminococcus sp. NSJ-142]|jgi:hypothetical protein|uniref:hypothetical protein n=1 Tax=Acidaminococcus TaxID=904 RepID=UPI0011AFDDE1|nr:MULTISPECIES: hypothetical protein [Acidaminococcus]MCD2434534.1 hypothetical protein [Acidaminococcus hominis]MCH4096924.1 hypothetical protein [Acidaminococcus provencensis]
MMDTNKTEQQAKEVLQKTASWGRKTFTARRLKKGAGCVLALAVLCGAGKIAAHKARANARLQEGEARTTLLQSLAAQKNITLVSTDQVKEAVANTLGTDPSSVTFRSVQLEDKLPNPDGRFQKDKKQAKDSKHDKRDQKEKQQGEKFQRGPQEGQPFAGKAPQGPKAPEKAPGTQPQAPVPNTEQQQLPESTDAQAQNQTASPAAKAPAAPQPGMPSGVRPQGTFKGMPLFYLADCEKDGMDYHFIVNAQNGQVIRAQVHKTNPLLDLLH